MAQSGGSGRFRQCPRPLFFIRLLSPDAPIFRLDHMPYGGAKASGLGREGLRYAIEELTEPRLLALKA